MQKPPRLTDRRALEAHRARAQRQGLADFLHEEARFEIQERLAEVNRAFTNPAIVTGFPDLWQAWFPEATVVSDDDVLDLRPGTHDLILHAMSLHWSDDPVGQIVQCRHALVEDGMFLAVLFGGQTLSELRSVLAEAELRHRGGIGPHIAPMAEVRDLGALLQRGGLALPVADVVGKRVEYQNTLDLMRDLRAMGETNALCAREARGLSRAIVADAAEMYAREFQGDNGRIRATYEFVFLTGWAPAASQPQPLRPGSAVQRLADALDTVEFNRELKPVNDPARPETGRAEKATDE